MLAPRTIDMQSAGRAIGTPLNSHAGDKQFIAAVFDYARTDEALALDLLTILAGRVDNGLVLRVAKEVVKIPAHPSIGSRGPGMHLSISPILFPRTRRHAISYALALLLDDDLSYRRDLRRCKLEGCGKFFLVYRPPTGRPRDRYCSPEHMQEQQDRGRSARVRKSRAKKRRAM